MDDVERSKSRIFISYSRTNSAFVIKLADDISTRGYVVDFDLASQESPDPMLGIAATDKWWDRIKEMISVADTVVFAVSNASILSHVCARELAYCRELNKRIIPVLLEPTNIAEAPSVLAELNVSVDFSSNSDSKYTLALALLLTVIDSDVDWFRKQSHFSALAHRWIENHEDSALLMSVFDLDLFESMQKNKPANAPGLGYVLLNYYKVSKEFHNERTSKNERSLVNSYVSQLRTAANDQQYELGLKVAAAGKLRLSHVSKDNLRSFYEQSYLNVSWNRLRVLIAANEHEEVIALSDCSTQIILKDKTDLFLQRSLSNSTDRLLLQQPASWIPSTDDDFRAEYSNVAFMDSLKQIAAVTLSNTVVFWSSKSGKVISEIEVPLDKFYGSISYYPDANSFVNWGQFGGVLRSLQTGKSIGIITGTRLLNPGKTYRSSEQILLTAKEKEIPAIWDTQTAKEKAVFGAQPNFVVHARVTENGRIVLWCFEGTVSIWNHSTQELLYEFSIQQKNITAVSATTSGKYICTVYDDGQAILTNVNDSATHASLDAQSTLLTGACFSPCEALICVWSAENHISLWDVRTNSKQSQWSWVGAPVRGIKYSQNGRQIISIHVDGSARVWDAAPNNLIGLACLERNCGANTGILSQLLFDVSDTRLLCLDLNSNLIRMNTSSGSLDGSHLGKEDTSSNVQTSHVCCISSEYIVTRDIASDTAIVRKHTSQNTISKIKFPAVKESKSDFSARYTSRYEISKRGDILVFFRSSKLFAFSVNNGSLLNEFDIQGKIVYAKVNTSGSIVFIQLSDHSVLWNPKTNEVIKEYKGEAYSVCFSGSDEVVAFGNAAYGGIRVENLVTGAISFIEIKSEIRKGEIDIRGLQSLALNECGDLMAIGTSNGFLALYDVNQGYYIYTTKMTVRGMHSHLDFSRSANVLAFSGGGFVGIMDTSKSDWIKKEGELSVLHSLGGGIGIIGKDDVLNAPLLNLENNNLIESLRDNLDYKNMIDYENITFPELNKNCYEVRVCYEINRFSMTIYDKYSNSFMALDSSKDSDPDSHDDMGARKSRIIWNLIVITIFVVGIIQIIRFAYQVIVGIFNYLF